MHVERLPGWPLHRDHCVCRAIRLHCQLLSKAVVGVGRTDTVLRSVNFTRRPYTGPS